LRIQSTEELPHEEDFRNRPSRDAVPAHRGTRGCGPSASEVLPPQGATTYVAEAAGRIVDETRLGEGEVETVVEVTGLTQNTLGQSIFDEMRAALPHLLHFGRRQVLRRGRLL
jgi:hypothetical protein